MIKPRKPSKYRNVKVSHFGMKFDSKREFARWQILDIMNRAGHIDELKLQHVFVLVPSVRMDGKMKPAIRYKADFSYRDCKTGLMVVEDVKSPQTMKTAAYRMKKHLMIHVHGIEIVEIK